MAAELNELARTQIAEGARVLPAAVCEVNDFICGCGEPVTAWEWLRAYLTEPRRTDSMSGAEWFAVYVVDHIGLTEHGTSISHPWLTDNGREVLRFIEESGADWAETGWWIDAEGCTQSMVPSTLPPDRPRDRP